jgi:Transposase DNA-binding/Transposase DDE domain
VLDLRSFAGQSIADEFTGVELGDPRRGRRLLQIVARAMAAPDIGFPQMVGDDSELEGLYRFLSNDHVAPEDVLQPHFAATVGRMREVAGVTLVAHDTTDLIFGGHGRKGLGPTNGNQHGFLAHVALAVLPGEDRLALGCCGLVQVCRTERKKTRNKSWYEMSKDPNRESLRWSQLLEQVSDRTGSIECIHLMDREGDNYDLLALMLRRGDRFVVRACHDRALVSGERLFHKLEALSPQAFRDIEVNERVADGERAGKHPPRSSRSARVAVAGCTVSVRQTQGAHARETELTVNVVRVWEPSPPAGEPAVSWILYTTEPIQASEELLAVVDYYRSRWIIEEFFKALKTGCSIEKRQLESYHALSIALAMFIPIAWRLLLARSISRAAPDSPATTIVTPVQLELLRHRHGLAKQPQTAVEAVYAIAKLGGHLKRNGPPGWLTLGRGFEALLLMEAGWRAATGQARSDQS